MAQLVVDAYVCSARIEKADQTWSGVRTAMDSAMHLALFTTSMRMRERWALTFAYAMKLRW